MLDKLNWDLVSEAIINEVSHLQGSQPLTSANKISPVKGKSDHLPSWKEKSREEQPNASGSGDQKKKGYFCTGKQVKEWREATKQCDHAYMAESAMVVDPPTPIAS